MKRLSRSRGFTLVELMISLVMGLIIALAVVALAKTATTTFHEQARLSSVEMALRSASERLRADLSKVSYMSTGNIALDPRVARRSGGLPAINPALAQLRGINISVGAGQARTQGTAGLATAQNPALNPDDLVVTGNLTSDDVYRGQWVGNGSCPGASAQIRLNALADPAVARLFNGATSTADVVRNVQSVFMPGESMQPPVTGQLYLSQLMDPRGCFHYVTVCAVFPGPNANTVLIDVGGDASDAILTPNGTSGDQCGGRVMEEFAIAPVQRVRWYLDANTTDTRLYDPVLEGTGANKFNLYRQLLAFDGVTPIGTPELVAEYAIDLKFGLVVDDFFRSPAPGNLQVFEMDANAAEITAWSNAPLSPTRGEPGPQRIRSVRYRVSVRSAQAERQTDLPVFPGSSNGLFRYCADPATSPCRKWARVRSLVSEVALINQARSFY